MENGSSLKSPINIGDLLNGGAEFQIDTDFKDDNQGEEYFIDDDYGSADEDEEKYKQLLTPWTRSFDELRQEMVQLSEHMYKRVMQSGVGEPLSGNIRVAIDYNAFFEKETKPFDSTTLRNKPFRYTLGAPDVLPGLDQAIQTMCNNEESQFLISYHLLFGEVGCPPRVKPKADGLFVIRVISYTEVGSENALDSLDESKPIPFGTVKQLVEQTRQYAKHCFKRNLLPNAISKYLKAVDTLQMCQLKDEAEQKEQQATLIALYTSLAVCYNHKEQPKDACRMVNELRNLCNINEHVKILYQEGKALYKLGEFDRARRCLLRAQKLEPRDENIQLVLKALDESSKKYKMEEKQIWSRALGIATSKQKEISHDENAFVKDLKESLKLFLDDEKCNVLSLPDALSEKEVSIMHSLADEFNLKLNIHVTDNKKHYKFQK
ncbi:inactive peptidyl-prolyl cis-trans isomerase shutdown [Anopheles nili]|uniref:inactive peptidyl-prolyl cis-trans isomerase shutdown n=1 Tax=Anopheles nili TaxID=185578 RepID=UPI00237C498E|nr:inactive peptidyl-prolyl cis-trans isomerase shutdown [Anopheles nili]